jgi:hypothetical protein
MSEPISLDVPSDVANTVGTAWDSVGSNVAALVCANVSVVGPESSGVIPVGVAVAPT